MWLWVLHLSVCHHHSCSSVSLSQPQTTRTNKPTSIHGNVLEMMLHSICTATYCHTCISQCVTKCQVLCVIYVNWHSSSGVLCDCNCLFECCVTVTVYWSTVWL
jgi:hypothetical protein